MNPIHVLTNFQRFPQQWRTNSLSGTAQRVSGAMNLLKQSSKADLILINGDVNAVLVLVLTYLLLPFLRKPIVAVDLVLRKPTSLSSRVAVFAKKILFRRVDHFVHYFKDLRGYETWYGIGPDRSTFVYFKANLHERVSEPPATEGDYVLCFGRSLRDYDTFFDAVSRLPYPAAVPKPNFASLAAHGTRWSRPLDQLPKQVTLLEDDGTAVSQIRLLTHARLVVIPILRQTLCASGVGTYLNAMLMRKCVIISEGPGVSDVLSDQVVAVTPEDSPALSAAIQKAWEDKAFRDRVAQSGHALALSVGGESDLHQRVLEAALPRFFASRI